MDIFDLVRRVKGLQEALEEILEIAADREDIRDTEDGHQAPNTYMVIAEICRRAI